MSGTNRFRNVCIRFHDTCQNSEVSVEYWQVKIQSIVFNFMQIYFLQIHSTALHFQEKLFRSMHEWIRFYRSFDLHIWITTAQIYIYICISLLLLDLICDLIIYQCKWSKKNFGKAFTIWIENVYAYKWVGRAANYETVYSKIVIHIKQHRLI